MIVLTGYKEIDELLRNLPGAVQEQIVSAANYQAAKPLVEREKQLSPIGKTRNLVESIGTVKKGKRTRVVGEVWVGPRQGGRYKGFHAKFFEFGTVKMKKRPFLEPAFEQTKDRVQAIITTELGKSVYRTMKRYIKNYG